MRLYKLNAYIKAYLLKTAEVAEETDVEAEAQSKLDNIETLWDNFRQLAYNVDSLEKYQEVLSLFDTIKKEILETISLVNNKPGLNYVEDQLRETYIALKEDMDDLEEEINEFQGASMAAMSGSSDEQAQKAYDIYKETLRKRQAKWWNKKLPIEQKEIRRKKYEAEKKLLESKPIAEQEKIKQQKKERLRNFNRSLESKQKKREQDRIRRQKARQSAREKKLLDILEKFKD